MWKFGYGANMTCKRKHCANNVVKKQNEYEICARHYFGHALKASYQWYNLCMSRHETAHSRHNLQLTSLARICENKAATNTWNNQTCCVLKARLAEQKLNTPCKLTRTCASVWAKVDSVVPMLYTVAFFQPHSLGCFFSGWVATSNMCTETYLRLKK